MQRCAQTYVCVFEGGEDFGGVEEKRFSKGELRQAFVFSLRAGAFLRCSSPKKLATLPTHGFPTTKSSQPIKLYSEIRRRGICWLIFAARLSFSQRKANEDRGPIVSSPVLVADFRLRSLLLEGSESFDRKMRSGRFCVFRRCNRACRAAHYMRFSASARSSAARNLRFGQAVDLDRCFSAPWHVMLAGVLRSPSTYRERKFFHGN